MRGTYNYCVLQIDPAADKKTFNHDVLSFLFIDIFYLWLNFIVSTLSIISAFFSNSSIYIHILR